MFKHIHLRRKKENKGALLAGGALIGGLVGAVAAVFLTPITGKKARQTVSKKAKESATTLSAQVKDTSTQIQQKASDLLKSGEENAKETARKTKSKAKSIVKKNTDK